MSVEEDKKKGGFRDLRERLADSIAAAGVGLMRSDIVVERQADIWNAVDEAAAMAENGVVLVIGIAEGRNKDTTGNALDFDVRLTLNLMVQPVTAAAGQVPEEEIWEKLVDHCHGLHVTGELDLCGHRFLVEGFGEVVGETNGWLVRQTILTKRKALARST